MKPISAYFFIVLSRKGLLQFLVLWLVDALDISCFLPYFMFDFDFFMSLNLYIISKCEMYILKSTSMKKEML